MNFKIQQFLPVAVLALVPLVASAEMIEVQVSGIIHTVTDPENAISGDIQVNDAFSWTFIFDNATIGTGDPNFNEFNDAIIFSSVTVGSYSSLEITNPMSEIGIGDDTNGFFDDFFGARVQSGHADLGLPFAQVDVQLFGEELVDPDLTHTDTLLTGKPVDFANYGSTGEFTLFFLQNSDPFPSAMANGTITSFTVTQVPEPSSLFLLCLTTSGWIALRRRKLAGRHDQSES